MDVTLAKDRSFGTLGTAPLSHDTPREDFVPSAGPPVDPFDPEGLQSLEAPQSPPPSPSSDGPQAAEAGSGARRWLVFRGLAWCLNRLRPHPSPEDLVIAEALRVLHRLPEGVSLWPQYEPLPEDSDVHVVSAHLLASKAIVGRKRPKGLRRPKPGQGNEVHFRAGKVRPAPPKPASLKRQRKRPRPGTVAPLGPAAVPVAPEDQACVSDWVARARHGEAQAQFYLGLMYFEGRGVATCDLDKAKYWFYLAQDRGHVKARHMLITVHWMSLPFHMS
jgi:hypothetical protein